MQDTLFEAGGASQDPAGIRSGFNHFNDIFSHFARYIAPAYHHERPERSIQMRLYTLHKGQYLLVFIMFVCLFFIALLMGMAGPRMVLEHKEKGTLLLSQYKSNKNLSAGPFEIVTPKLSTYRQQMWISAQITIKEKEQAIYSTSCTATLTIEGIVDRKTKVLIGHKDISRTRFLTCKDKNCDPFIILHLGALEYTHYLVNVSFDGLASVDKYFTIEDIFFRITTYNPDFTQMEVWFRFFFVITTVLVSMAFFISMRKFHLEDWAIEQKWTAMLLSTLVAFNDPIYPLTLTSRNVIPSLCDVFLQASFLFCLLIFWLCIFHALRQTERGFWSFYSIKVVIVGSMWFSAVVMTALEEVNQLRDPSFSYELNDAHYKNFQRFFVIMLAIYTVYLIYLSLRAFGELRSMNFLDARLKFHAASLLVVLSLTLSILLNRLESKIEVRFF